MGDACGIGPEIIAAWFRSADAGSAFVVGDVAVMRRAVGFTGGLLPVARIDAPDDAAALPAGCIPVLQADGVAPDLIDAPLGRVDARAGAAAARCIEQAVAIVAAGAAAAIVTAPIHKEAFAAAGIGYPGHTEMLQALAAGPGAPAPPVRMMLANDELRVVLVTIHLSLRRAIDALSEQGIVDTLAITHAAGLRFGLAAPRIAVAGLNPHAGEHGLFGREEEVAIAPAIAACRDRRIDVSGPFPADTLFVRAARGEFDVVIACYHDQGLIPVKLVAFGQAVNLTLGLPIVRTSVDHGTAFDIAGKGVADPGSMIAAVRLAAKLCRDTR